MFEIETTKETELISWQINKQKPKNKDNKETRQSKKTLSKNQFELGEPNQQVSSAARRGEGWIALLLIKVNCRIALNVQQNKQTNMQ